MPEAWLSIQGCFLGCYDRKVVFRGARAIDSIPIILDADVFAGYLLHR